MLIISMPQHTVAETKLIYILHYKVMTIDHHVIGLIMGKKNNFILMIRSFFPNKSLKPTKH